jgi:hypothetical protein
LGRIQVCPLAVNAPRSAATRRAVRTEYATASGLRFGGWGDER